MKLKRDKTENTGTNYYFILGCLGALTTAALITVGAISVFAAQAGAAATLTAAAFVTTAASMTVTASILPILFPILGAIALITAICALPFLFSCDPGPYVPTTVVTTPGYRPDRGPLFFHPTPSVVTTGGYVPHYPHQHGHVPNSGGFFDNHYHSHNNVPNVPVDNHHHGHNTHMPGHP